jgi:hypothetical protein
MGASCARDADTAACLWLVACQVMNRAARIASTASTGQVRA